MDEIIFLNTKNFYSFKIDNFLTKEIYEELEHDFPDYHVLKEQQSLGLVNRQNNKFIFAVNTKEYSRFLQESKVFNSFHKRITSKEFFFQIYNNFEDL